MALVAQAGIAYFDKGRIRKFRSTNGVRVKKEKDNNMTQVPSGDDDMEEDKLSTQLSTQLLNLVRTNEIPKVEGSVAEIAQIGFFKTLCPRVVVFTIYFAVFMDITRMDASLGLSGGKNIPTCRGHLKNEMCGSNTG